MSEHALLNAKRFEQPIKNPKTQTINNLLNDLITSPYKMTRIAKVSPDLVLQLITLNFKYADQSTIHNASWWKTFCELAGSEKNANKILVSTLKMMDKNENKESFWFQKLIDESKDKTNNTKITGVDGVHYHDMFVKDSDMSPALAL